MITPSVRPELQRFWFLETVARMPYFSYISMLHLYESLGWWRAGAELRRVRRHALPSYCFLILPVALISKRAPKSAHLHWNAGASWQSSQERVGWAPLPGAP